MKNLKLYSEPSMNLDLQSRDETIIFSAFDIERNRLFFASSNNFIYTAHISSSSCSSTEPEPIDLEYGDMITSLDYIMEKEALVVGTSSGLLLLYNVDDSVTEVVGRVEGGVKYISPSPDGDLLGVVTSLGQILVMTHDWDLLYETALEDIADDVDVCEHYSLESPISWRGDGKFFATLSEVPDSTSSHKKIKIWERDSGALHAASEPNTFMGSIVEWMPCGAKIAAVYDQNTKNKCPSIVFFEKNGLERSSFGINDLPDATIEILKWNCRSDLLAAIVRFENFDAVKIWSFSNNHWSLKQEIRFLKNEGVRLMWNPTSPLQMICWTLNGQVSVLSFVWLTAVMENSTALVIDGSKILVTPLSVSIIPPPMCSFNLNFPCPVREFAFWSKDCKNKLATVLSNGSLCIIELPVMDTWEELEGREISVESSYSEANFGSFFHLIWLDSHLLLGFSHLGSTSNTLFAETSSVKNDLSGYYLQEIEVVCSEDQDLSLGSFSGWNARISKQILLEGPIVGVATDPLKRGSALLQFEGGKIFEYKSKVGINMSTVSGNDVSFTSSCPWMDAVIVSESGSLTRLLFGLDENGRLHINGKILCSNCSSFSCYSNSGDQLITHMILTTKQDLLYVVDTIDVLNENLVKYENFIPSVTKRREEATKNSINMWEKGAKIVGVVHGDEAAVVLQTTRGNLECIYPRKLVLASIINALVQGRFRDAILMVRRQRIDFNVIIDHCGWENFLQSATEFVKQVNNLSYITEFVCSIKVGNIMETLYKDYLSLPSSKALDMQATDMKDLNSYYKISSVLLAIRKALEEQVPESPEREICILTTLARSDPPALEEALERIKVIRDMELCTSDTPVKMSCPSAEEALKHLLWLSESDSVYEAALGLYDLNLAAIVALNSQRDPKEFLPFLQQLELMPVHLMRYNIDLKLQRFENALKYIVAAGDDYYEDCMNLIKKNPQLFPQGLQLMTDPVKKRQILEAWGDYLTSEKCFEEAAESYLCSSNLEKALSAYRACGNWGGVLTVAGLLKLGEEETVQLAIELAEELQALGKPGDAAKIAIEYCNDINNGINLLISAREWVEALRVAFMHQRDDLVTEIENSCLECATLLVSEYDEGLEKLGKYLARYLAVRQRRLLLAAKIQSEESSFDDRDDDTASETSSTFSGMSAYTTGTSKGSAASTTSKSSKARGIRRQRNRGKIRAGSPDEEIALVEHFKCMSLTTGGKRELKLLLVSLLMLGKEERARKLQRTAENFQFSQMAAVKLAEETQSNTIIDEHAHTLEHYTHKVRSGDQHSEALSWRSKVLLCPSEG